MANYPILTYNERYYIRVLVDGNSKAPSELLDLAWAIDPHGDLDENPDSAEWKNYPVHNNGPSPSIANLEVDGNVVSSNAILYYDAEEGVRSIVSHYDPSGPMGSDRPDGNSTLWVKFYWNGVLYTMHQPIRDYEFATYMSDPETAYYGNNFTVTTPTPPGPSTGTKYRIYVKRSDTHVLINNENIIVGNLRDCPPSKITSGLTSGAEYSYVEFNSWQELTDAAGGGSGPTPPPGPTEYLTISISKDSFAHEGDQAVLSINSNTDWEIRTSYWINVRGSVTGSGSLVMEVEIDENVMSSEARTGNITVTTSGGLIRNLQVVQRAEEGEISHKLVLGMNQMSVNVGETVVITATYQTYQGGSLIQNLDVTDFDSVIWRSTDVGIARVEAGGRVTGVFEGSTQINATYEGETSDWTWVNVY